MDEECSLDDFVEGLDYPMFVVTTVDARAGTRAGCVVGFATQCSIGPARFLVCLSNKNRTFRVAGVATVLAVHLLGRDQRALAELFGTVSGDEVDKFERCGWRPGPRGVPILDGCPRWFVGEVLERLDLGDHSGFLLRPVEDAAVRDVPEMTFSMMRDLEAGNPA